MNWSEIIGLNLEEALVLLYSRNFLDIELKHTAPAQSLIPQGRARVIRALGDATDHTAKVSITIAFENYLKGGVESGI